MPGTVRSASATSGCSTGPERADALCAARNVAAARAPHPTLMRFDDFTAARTAQLPIAARTAA